MEFENVFSNVNVY